MIRLVGAWTDATSAAIADLRQQAESWMHEDLVTLQNILGRTEGEPDRIRAALAALDEKAASEIDHNCADQTTTEGLV